MKPHIIIIKSAFNTMHFDRSPLTCSCKEGSKAFMISNLALLLAVFRVSDGAASTAVKGLMQNHGGRLCSVRYTLPLPPTSWDSDLRQYLFGDNSALSEFKQPAKTQGGLKMCQYFHPRALWWREPVWPSGKALGWWAEGPRFESASALLSLQKLWFVDTVMWLCPSQFIKH